MKPRLLIFFWLGLLLPTLLAGGLLFRLLRNEKVRIETSQRMAAEGHARALAHEIAFTISDVKEQLLDGVAELTTDELIAWRARHPLVRNVFAWRDDNTVLVPDRERGLTEEEAKFLERYEPIFSGRQPWQSHARSDKEVAWKKNRRSPAQEIRAINMENLADLRQTEDESDLPNATGWVPWFSGKHLYFLGWVQHGTQNLYTGVELEMAAVISRLVNLLPATPLPETTTALLDGNGEVVFQRGLREVDGRSSFSAILPVGEELPHWNVAVYAQASGMTATSRAFTLLALAISGTFVVVVVSSGTLLMWHARRHLLDARRKTTFVSNVSHELKTPLTTIRMYAEMLGEGRVKDPSRQAEYLETMIRESGRLTRLINNVLDFSRIEQGRKRYRMELLDLCDIVRGVLATQAERLKEAGVDLTVEDGRGSCAVNADRDAVEQVALNLVDNAIKYAATGGRLLVQFSAEEGAMRRGLHRRGRRGFRPPSRESI